MSRVSSSRDVREKHLKALGPQLGPVYHELYTDVAWLHAKWLEYRKLFGHSPERIRLLNRVAGYFFKVMQDAYWDDVLLGIARLTDPPQSGNRSNLSLQRLPILIPDDSLSEKVRTHVDEAVNRAGFVRDWRNKRLAHRDLAVALEAGVETIPGANRRDVENCLSAIADVLNTVHRHYFGGVVAFDRFLAVNDGDSLAFYLEAGVKAVDRERDELRHRATGRSKWDKA